MRLTIVLLLVFTALIIPQKFLHKKFQGQTSQTDIFFELHHLPDDSLNTFFFFKIPYDKSIFIKKNNDYISEVNVNLEVRGEDKKVILRSTQRKIAVTSSFQQTNSNNKYIEGVFKMSLPAGKFLFFPAIEFINLSRVINFPEITYDINFEKEFFKPFICKNFNGSSDNFIYKNFSDCIPFSNYNFNMLIPIKSNSELPISVNIKQNDKLILSLKNITNIKNFGIKEIDSSIIFFNTENKAKYLILKNINKKLYEGKCEIEIFNSKSREKFDMDVVWFEKPNSLRDPENSIELLRLIDNDVRVDSLLDIDEDNYSRVLFDYWEKSDPDTSTSFNEIMQEFYSRVDYADKYFSVFNKKKGSTTDRGIVYIKYGEPDEIIRNFAEIDATNERWIYNNLKLHFDFFDNTGTGNFILKK